MGADLARGYQLTTSDEAEQPFFELKPGATTQVAQ